MVMVRVEMNMGVSKDAVSESTSPFEDMVLIDDIDDFLGSDDDSKDEPVVNLKVKADLLEIIDSIVYEVAETKAMTVISSGLDKVVEYLNDNGLSTKEILEIIELRRDAGVVNTPKQI